MASCRLGERSDVSCARPAIQNADDRHWLSVVRPAALAAMLALGPGCADAAATDPFEPGQKACLDFRGERWCLPGETLLALNGKDDARPGALVRIPLPPKAPDYCSFPVAPRRTMSLLVQEANDGDTPQAFLKRAAEAWATVYRQIPTGIEDVLAWCSKPGRRLCSYEQQGQDHIFTQCKIAEAPILSICETIVARPGHYMRSAYLFDCFAKRHVIAEHLVSWFDSMKVTQRTPPQ